MKAMTEPGMQRHGSEPEPLSCERKRDIFVPCIVIDGPREWTRFDNGKMARLIS